jgi:hypothetical protein
MASTSAVAILVERCCSDDGSGVDEDDMTATATAVFIPSPLTTRQGNQTAYDSDGSGGCLQQRWNWQARRRAKLRESHVKAPTILRMRKSNLKQGKSDQLQGLSFPDQTQQVPILHSITIASIKQAFAAAVGKMHSALTYQPVARCSVCRCP